MIRWIPTGPIPKTQPWQSRQEILKAHLDSLTPDELRRVRPDYYWLRFSYEAWKRDQARSNELTAFRFRTGMGLGADLWAKAGFRGDQPRWPAGSGDVSGRWSGGVGTASPGPGQNPGQPTRGGHHYVPRQIFESEPLRPETRRVFEQKVTGPLKGGPHQNSTEHSIYNGAVYEHYKKFLRENGIRSEDMTPEQARKFVDEVKGSRDPRVRDFNLKIFRREFLYQLRRIPRRTE